MATFERAGGAATDVKEDYKEEVSEAMQKAIARAWSDGDFKSELIANPTQAFADLGVHWPDHYNVEFYDDPSAKVGDWSTVGKGQTAILRVPIPAAPAGGKLSTEDLDAVAGAGDNCCCCTGLCTCTGAVSNDTWY
jgi:hypothetical protein